MKIIGHMVDVFQEKIYSVEITFDKKIRKIKRIGKAPKRYILPGLVNAHVHTESSMLIPSEFARLAIKQGTVAVVADPHEIANVCGINGINFMIKNAKKVPLKFYFGASSCVPATGFETNGAKLGKKEIEKLLKKNEIKFLAEVMNYPGVINRDPEIMEKIKIAKKYSKRIDGHAPGLVGTDLDRYISAGIETDHECYMLNEAKEKMKKGMKIIVREGSAAKNLDEIYPILKTGKCMLCTDDSHPDDLFKGHINKILEKCVKLGIDPITAIKSATKNPVEHYGLDCGLLREDDNSDFIIVNNLKNFNVKETWINGKQIYKHGKVKMKRIKENKINKFSAKKITINDLKIAKQLPVIEAIDGSLITNKLRETNRINLKKDILKIVIINRYKKTKPAIGFVKKFGMKKGAFGSSVMHDSHNIGIVGTDDESICKVANEIIMAKGGLVVYDGKQKYVLRLPFAGLMTDENGEKVAEKYEKLTKIVKKLGCKMHSPFMTLSFMGLLVLPHLKISDKGVFDVDKFDFV
ncbi:MAG: adenine deaminase [Candidatus Micrarchaeota archaeon]